MPGFEDMGLREELIQVLEDHEITQPTELQQAVIPALRRGGNLVARASSGSGRTLAYGLGVLDRLEAGESDSEDAATRVLIITPSPHEAERTALAITAIGQALDLPIAAVGIGWRTPPVEAAVVVSPAGTILDAIRGSGIKLDGLQSVVVDSASTILELGGWPAVDEVMDLIPRDTQRIFISPSFPPAVQDTIERRVKKALHYPAEPALPDQAETPPSEGRIAYVVATEREKLELLAEQLRDREPGSAPPIIYCRSDERAADLAERLSTRGFLVGGPDGDDVDVIIAAADVSLAEIAEEIEDETGQTISFDVPPDPASLRARHGGDEDAVVLVLPRELAHLREIARRANLEARSTPLPASRTAARSELAAFRQAIRTGVQQEDLTAQMLVLEPLLEEFTATEIAAALAGMLRSRKPAPPEGPSPATGEVEPRKAEKSARPGPAPVTWARLFVGIGARDEVRPGDIVGALAGEANIPGSRIGKIEIRDSFSIVEVQADVADQVINAVNGTTLKGRSVRVDYDRGGPARRPPAGKGNPPRRTSRRPPS